MLVAWVVGYPQPPPPLWSYALCTLSSSLDLLRVCFVGGRILSLIQWNRLPDWDKIYDFMIIVQHLLMTKIKIKLLERVPDVFVTLFSIQFDQIVCLYSPHLPLLPYGCVCVWGLRESCWFLELVRGQGSLAWVRAICHDTRAVAA